MQAFVDNRTAAGQIHFCTDSSGIEASHKQYYDPLDYLVLMHYWQHNSSICYCQRHSCVRRSSFTCWGSSRNPLVLPAVWLHVALRQLAPWEDRDENHDVDIGCMLERVRDCLRDFSYDWRDVWNNCDDHKRLARKRRNEALFVR